MNIFKKIKEVFPKDLKALFKSEDEYEEIVVNYSDQVPDVKFKGAWEEEGKPKWVAFKPDKPEKDIPDEIAGKSEKIEFKKEEIPAKPEVKKEPLIKRREVKEEPPVQVELKEETLKKLPVQPEIKKEPLIKKCEIKEEIPVQPEIKKKPLIKKAETKDALLIKRHEAREEALIKKVEIKEEPTVQPSKIKVFFVEDNQSFQHILRTIIKRSNEMELLDFASDGEEAVDKIENMDVYPDVILMDIAMPRMKGIEATKEILKINPKLKILMLTAFGDKENVINAFAAGALGFLRKDAGAPLIRDAIIKVGRGAAPPMQDEIATYLLDGIEDFY